MVKKFRILLSIFVLLIFGLNLRVIAYSDFYSEMQADRFFLNNFWVFSIYIGAFNSNLMKKYPNAKNSSTECYKLIKEYMAIKGLTNSVHNTLRDVDIKYYCRPELLKNSSFSEENTQTNQKKVKKEIDFTPYRDALQNKIKANWYPPRGSEQNSAVILFVIDRNGHIISKRILQSSGNIDFDNSALDTIQKSAPFAPLPKEYDDTTINVQFTFNYYNAF